MAFECEAPRSITSDRNLLLLFFFPFFFLAVLEKEKGGGENDLCVKKFYDTELSWMMLRNVHSENNMEIGVVEERIY